MSDPLDMLTINQAAAILQKTPETIREYIKKYNIPHVRRYEGDTRPKKYYIARGELEKFIYGQWNNYENRK
jgi:hypothetical protein